MLILHIFNVKNIKTTQQIPQYILQKQILTKRNSGRNVQPQFSLNLHCLTGTRSDTNKIGRFSIKLSLKISICEDNKCQISNH